MEPITSIGDEHSNTGSLQEKIGPPSVISTLIWIPALSKRLDWMHLQAPSVSIILQFYDSVVKGLETKTSEDQLAKFEMLSPGKRRW